MRIGIIGRGEILLECAERIYSLGHDIPVVITAKEAPEYKVTRKDYKLFAERVGALFAQTAKIDDDDIYNILERCQPLDIAISINYSGVISERVISYFKLGILNAHGGDLPRFRGNACQSWALLNGEEKIALCVHKMIGGELDSGNILAKEFMHVNINTRIGQVYEWIAIITPDLMIKVIRLIEKDHFFIGEAQSKDPKDALRCYPRDSSDGRIDWNCTSVDVLRLINASSEPFAGAFAEYEGQKIIIWRAELINDEEKFFAVPGQVLKIGTDFIEVSCKDGKIKILEVEYQGIRAPPNKFIQSIRKRLK